MSNKSIKSILEQERKLEIEDIENEIVEWILMNRSLRVLISLLEDIVKTYRLNKELKQKGIGIFQ